NPCVDHPTGQQRHLPGRPPFSPVPSQQPAKFSPRAARPPTHRREATCLPITVRDLSTSQLLIGLKPVGGFFFQKPILIVTGVAPVAGRPAACARRKPQRRPSASSHTRSSALSTNVPFPPVVPQRRPPQPRPTVSSPAIACSIRPPIVHSPSSPNLAADQQTHLADSRSGRGGRRLKKATALHRSLSLQ
ncbi:hypothetical protein ACLOJK_009018, partial [Asimina triloba]